MRTLVIGDIHGGLRGFTQLEERMGLNKADKLIFLGDYVDGWSESAQVIQYLMERSKTNTCIFIKGNHDVWCEDWLRTNEVNSVWYNHGGKETIQSYDRFSEAEKQGHLKFFEAMKLYHIDADNRLYLHAGFTSMHGVEKENHEENFYFDRTLWEMALIMDRRVQRNSEVYPNRLKHYSEIYIGHTPTINYNIMHPMNAANVWNIDTGAAFTGKLSGINIESKAVYQSDALPDLYPDEKGRNKD